MTEVHASALVPAGQVFDAALARGQATMDDPMPVLAQVDPERSVARNVGMLSESLSARFAYSAPAARVAELHRKSVADLFRLERRFYWRWIRGTIADFLLSYWLAILIALVVVGLVVVAVIFREAIIASISALVPKAPVLNPPAIPPQTLPVPLQGPAGVAPPISPSGAVP